MGGRYAKWYDEYIYPYENPPDLLECDSSDSVPLNPLNGYAVYKLRCSLLHEGSIDIQDTVEKNLHKSQQVYRKLEFHLTDKLTSSGFFWEPGKKNEQLITIRIGIEDFSNKICLVAEDYYKNHSTDNIFNEVISYDFL